MGVFLYGASVFSTIAIIVWSRSKNSPALRRIEDDFYAVYFSEVEPRIEIGILEGGSHFVEHVYGQLTHIGDSLIIRRDDRLTEEIQWNRIKRIAVRDIFPL
jgi:hypothetical protein